MNNFKPTFFNNVDNIAGEHDSFRINIDCDGNLVLSWKLNNPPYSTLNCEELHLNYHENKLL